MYRKYLYNDIMSKKPYVYDGFVNSMNQMVVLLEHPTEGDDAPVIVSFPEHGVMFDSGFMETDDMKNMDGDYVPHLVDGEMKLSYEL